MKLFGGNGNPAMAAEVASRLRAKLGAIEVDRFSEGEIRVKVNENVRGTDVFILQSTCPPINDNCMELLIMIDAFRRASARRITAVMPFFAYARQDRKDQPRVPITAKLFANLIEAAGADRVLTMDLHADQIQGFFDVPLDHLTAVPVAVSYLKRKGLRNPVVASPDVGGIKDAWKFADAMGVPLAIVDKRRSGPVTTKVMNIIGEVRGRDVIIPDDMIASGSSMVEAAAALRRMGARDIYGFATHGIFSGPAVQRLNGRELKEMIVTNTIPMTKGPASIRKPKMTTLSVAPLFAEAIRRIHEETSISALLH
jgi:ribose-phosphate pyrophosphokinase